jgi:glycosyltransferase involved in cell wall biosynthesis
MISDDVRACEWEHYRNPGVRISNWLDSSHYREPSVAERADARASLAIEDGTVVLISVGNCNVAKNHEALLRAITFLPSDLKILYLHVGNEPADAPERRLAKQLQIASSVRFVGSQRDPLPLLWASDLFVMPSLFEGVGMSALEAASAGLPLVLSDVAGLRGVAAHLSNCVLTTTDPRSIASGIAQVARLTEAERLRQGNQDSAKIRELYSISRGVTSIVRGLYSATQQARGMQTQDVTT